jgi:hypothetical protein
MEGHLAKTIRKQCLKKFLRLLWIPLLAWIIILYISNFRISFLWQPVITLRSGTNMQEGVYVKFEDVKLYSAGAVRLTNGRETNIYLFFYAQDKFVITMLPLEIADDFRDKETVTIIGLVDPQRDYELNYGVIEKLTEDAPEYEAYFSEYFVRYDKTIYLTWGFAWICALISAVPFYWLIKYLRVMLDYKNHPAIREYAESLELEKLEQDLEDSYQEGKLLEAGDSIFLSKHYYVCLKNGSEVILRINNLLWAYVEEVQKSAFSVRDYLFLYFKDPVSNLYGLQLKKNSSLNDDVLKTLYPSIHVGLNPDNIAWYEEQIKDVG